MRILNIFKKKGKTPISTKTIKFECPNCKRVSIKNYLDVPIFRTSKVICSNCEYIFVKGGWADIPKLIQENKEITYV